MTTPDTFFSLHMLHDGALYAPELDGPQLTDRDTLIADILAGQFLGDFASLIQHERDASGRVHSWDVSAEVFEGMEADEDDDCTAYDRIDVYAAGVEAIQRAL